QRVDSLQRLSHCPRNLHDSSDSGEEYTRDYNYLPFTCSFSSLAETISAHSPAPGRKRGNIVARAGAGDRFAVACSVYSTDSSSSRV
ncbi:MAG: hypothetical protein LN417_00175, partial [Candidatus Thermoplasmatota archaeon]|nr:hypothetical protein [Candidatus Thermoplasmatota archaeon]